MLLDSQGLFSENQEITSGTIYSTNTVKFGSGDVSFVPVIIQVTEAFTNAQDLTVKIQTSENSDFSSSVDLLESKMLLKDLTLGAKFPINYLPKGNKGYIRLAYIVGENGPETTGKITAGAVASHELSYHEI